MRRRQNPAASRVVILASVFPLPSSCFREAPEGERSNPAASRVAILASVFPLPSSCFREAPEG